MGTIEIVVLIVVGLFVFSRFAMYYSLFKKTKKEINR